MAVHSMASPTTRSGTSTSPWRTCATGRVAAGPSDSRATPPGTCSAWGHTVGAGGKGLACSSPTRAGWARRPAVPIKALRRLMGVAGRMREGRAGSDTAGQR